MTTSPTLAARPARDMLAPALRLLFAAAVMGLALAPFWAGRADLRLLMEALSFLALAQMWNLLAGFTGLISVGQQAWVGFGGYLLFALTMFMGVPPLAAIPAAAVVAGLLAIPTGWIAFRLRGPYFAIGTWVIADVFRLVAAQVGALGGGSGISLPVEIAKSLGASKDSREMVMYYLAFAIGLASVAIVWGLLRSRWGLALTAIRDNEAAAEAVGVMTRRVKFLIYVLTAGFTGLAGAFIFLQKLRITPDAAFSVNEWTAYVIFIVVIGGIGSIEGPILGVVIFFTLRQIAADWGSWYPILMGVIAIAVMLINKRGLWGAIRAWGDIAVFPVSRTLPVSPRPRTADGPG